MQVSGGGSGSSLHKGKRGGERGLVGGCPGGMSVKNLHVEMRKCVSDGVVGAWNVLCRDVKVVLGS